jgi:hypothetical protein
MSVKISGVLCLVVFLVACGFQEASRPRTGAMPEKTISVVLKEHTPRLMALPGVVGTAEGRCDGRPCIKVYVREKTPEIVKHIPSQIDGYSVTVQETGEIRPLGSH